MKKTIISLLFLTLSVSLSAQQFNINGLGHVGNIKYFGSLGIEYQTAKRSFFQINILGGNFGKASFDSTNMKNSPYVEANRYGQWWDYKQTIMNIKKQGIGVQIGYGYKLINKEKHHVDLTSNIAYYLVFDKSYHEFEATNSLVLPSSVKSNLVSRHNAISIGIGANYRYLLTEKMGLIVGVNFNSYSSFDSSFESGRYYPSILRSDEVYAYPMIGIEPTLHFGITYKLKL